ncbi:addiction module antidote protein [Rhizobium sp. 0TCS1.26]|uniref:addiction module antidote protein n=1 Tax=Rhizobium sp. 0TCS1.26 TaxID=3142623 RepID=UPI003D2E565A
MIDTFTSFDPADLLKTDEAIEAFLTEAFETDDAAYIARAIGVVARAKGMTAVARETGLAREQLYRSLSESGNPTLETTVAVLKALGLQLTAKPRAA